MTDTSSWSKGNGSTTASDAVKVEYVEEPAPAKPPVPWLLSPKALAAVAWASAFMIIWLALFGLLPDVVGGGTAFVFFVIVAVISGVVRWPR